MMDILEVKNLYKSYKNGDEKLQIIKGLDFSLPKGKRMVITGESGCGKSTFLNMVGSLDQCDSGQIIVDGTDITTLDPAGLCQYRNHTIGFVFQFHYLLKELTALENVMIPAMVAGLSMKEATARAEELLESVKMTHRKDFYPSRLSGGERQRVAVARALVNNPVLLLADEPTGNLDQDNSRLVEKLLFQIVEERKTSLILVTHDPTIASHGDIKVKLEKGKFVTI